MPDENKAASDQWGPDPAHSTHRRKLGGDGSVEPQTADFADLDPAPPARRAENASATPSVSIRADWSLRHSGRLPDSSRTDFLAWKRLWGALTGPAVIAAMSLLFGILGFFVATRLLELYATIASLSPWEAWCAILLLGLFVGAILVAGGYFVLAYQRLRRNRQVQLDELTALSQRTSSRRQETMESLAAYLEAYGLEDSARAVPINDTTRQELLEAKRQLLGEWRLRLKRMPDLWVARYVEAFQNKLDEEASERVAQAATLVAFKTAVSPNPLADTAIVLFWSFKLLGDLCRIYNLRLGAFGTAALLSRVFFVAYVAGRLDEWEEHAEENLEGVLDHLPAPDLAKNIVGRIGAKTGAGLANYFLVRRLGKRAIEMLKPVRT